MTVTITLPKERIRIDIPEGNLRDILDIIETVLKPYKYSVKDAIDGIINVKFE